MAADLGSWPAEQATVLLEVLHNAGLHPQATRSRGEVHVTVPDDEGDRANATLVAQMDTIAKAARPPRGGGASARGRRLRAVPDPEPSGRRRQRRGDQSGGRRRTDRPRSSPPAAAGRATPAVIAGVGFATAFGFAAAGSAPTFPLVVMTTALVWVLGKRAQRI